MSIAKLAAAESELDYGTEPFSEIRSLPEARIVAPELPKLMLPPQMRAWIVDISDRMQVPLAMVAAPALVALSAVVGRRVGIHPKAKDDWLVVPNLWGAVVARPGRLKSPSLAEALRPLRKVAEKAQEASKQEAAQTAARVASLKAKESAVKDQLKTAHKSKAAKGLSTQGLEAQLAEILREIDDQEAFARDRRFIVNDTTTEKLGELLRGNRGGLLLERDELAGWLRALDRDDRRGDREFFLEAWNGNGSYAYDRISRGTIQIPALCLSVVGGIQPAKLAQYVSHAVTGSHLADGLLQRFQLLVWPEEPTSWDLVDKSPDHEAREKIVAIFQRISELPIPEGEAVPALRFCPEAQRMFYEWLTNLERRLAADELSRSPAFECHLSKYRSLMPALALLFHQLEYPGLEEPVTLHSAGLAADWCDFLEDHAQKVYAPELNSELVAAHALAQKIRDGAVGTGMSIRDVYKSDWSNLKSSDDVAKASRILAEHGWVRVESQTSPAGGRPKQVLFINPLVKGMV